MLLIQHIHLHWQKECRGAPYSTVRSHMPKAWMLPDNFMELKSGFYLNLKQKKQGREQNLVPYPTHYVYLRQNKDGIREETNIAAMHNEVESIRIGAIEANRKDNSYEVRYKYDYHRAIPERIFYDPKLNSYRSVDETAMNLAPGEYGRLSYNGRFIECDSGNWYYELHIVNLLNLVEDTVAADIFCSREPDYMYSQLAQLI